MINLHQEEKKRNLVILNMFNEIYTNCISVSIPPIYTFEIDSLLFAIHNGVTIENFKSLANFTIREDENIVGLSELVSGTCLVACRKDLFKNTEDILEKMKNYIIQLYQKGFTKDIVLDVVLNFVQVLNKIKKENNWTFVALHSD